MLCINNNNQEYIMLSKKTHININTLKNLSTELYWHVKTETDNILNAQWNSLIHNFTQQYNKNFYWKFICNLYKIYRNFSKPTITHTNTQSITKPQNEATLSKPITIKKHKFTGSNPNTATANFLQFMKAEKGMSPDSSISHKLRTEWKEEKHFDPKIYHSELEWFKWIENNMIIP